MWCPDLVICTCFVIQMSWEDRFVCFSFKKVKIGFQSNKLKSPKIKRLVNSVSVLSLQEKTETETRQKGFSASRIKDNNFCKVKKLIFQMRILVIVHCALCSMRWREEKGGVKSSSAWEFALIFTLVAIMPRTIFGINAIMVMAPDMITFASQHLLFRVTHEFIPQFHPRAHCGRNLNFVHN